MTDQHQKKLLKSIVSLLVLLIVFFVGAYMGQKGSLASSSINIPDNISVTNEQFDPFWKVWKILSEKYVAATTTDSQKRIWGAIQGLTASQGDPYTVFFPPEESAMFKSDISGNFEGVGMEIGLKDGIITVVAPIKGSPADLAGIKTGDNAGSVFFSRISESRMESSAPAENPRHAVRSWNIKYPLNVVIKSASSGIGTRIRSSFKTIK